MKAKHIFSFILAASLMSACTSEDLVESTGELKGKMMDASNFSLVSDGVFSENAESRASYYPQYVYVSGESLKAKGVKPTWQANDKIGFSHIYRTTREITTNYEFTLDPADAGKSTAAKFNTDNSTIFEGDYFVYYPYNNQYADYEGIPFELKAVQTQDATVQLKVNDITPDTYNPATHDLILSQVGKHLAKFSISPRIEAVAQMQQTEFALEQYTSTLGFIIYPLNQTNDINVTRIEMISATAEPLEIPTKVRFNEVNNEEIAVPAVVNTAENAVLLFENVDPSGNGGLTIAYDATEETATLAYMSMIPAKYTEGSYKFVVYYTENSITKKREIEVESDLNLTRNKTTFVKLEVNAHGATEVVDNEIWTETEFASAVAKSNEVTNGAVEYTIMQPITLKADYVLESAVPVTFNGGQTVTLEAGKRLQFNSDANIEFNNIVASETTGARSYIDVLKGNVTIQGVNGALLALNNTGETTIMNAGGKGELELINNFAELTLANVNIVGLVNNGFGTETAVLDLSNATIGTGLISNTEGSVTLNTVTITTGGWTNTKGDMSVTNLTITDGGWICAAGNITANTVTITNGAWNTNGNLDVENVTVNGNYWTPANTFTANMTNVNVYSHFEFNGSVLNLDGVNVLGYNPTTETSAKFESAGNTTINVTNSTTTVGNLSNVKLNLAKGDDEEVVFTVKGTSDLTNAATFVYVDSNATYNAEGEVTGLESAKMTLEGTLTTDANVALAADFQICGTIENKADGVWVLDGLGVKKYSHQHSQAPKFTNAGTVIVEDVTTLNAVETVANVLMSDDLYDAASTGRLVWKGMTTFAIVDDIYALGADCYATDLHAVLAANTSANPEAFAEDLNWSDKNIIAEVKNVEYYGNFATDKKLSAKNFTVITNGSSATTSFTLNGGTTDLTNGLYVVNVTETLSLKNIAEHAGAADLTSAICKDLYVFNEETGSAIFSIANGLRMNYTNTYVPEGDNYHVSWVNDKPVKK